MKRAVQKRLGPRTVGGEDGESSRREGAVADQGGVAAGCVSASPTLTWAGNALLLDGRLCANVLYMPRSRWRVSLYRADLVVNCRVVVDTIEAARSVATGYASRGALP